MKLALMFESFEGGGAQRVMVNLANEFNRKNHDVVIYVIDSTGPYLKLVHHSIKIIEFPFKLNSIEVIPSLRKQIFWDELDILLSTQSHINLLVGVSILGLKNRPKVVYREPSLPSLKKFSIIKRVLKRVFYRKADSFVAISKGVKERMVEAYKVAPDKVKVIYNPIVDPKILSLASKEVDHSWFVNKKEPVIVTAGRVVPIKDFLTLIKGFHLARKEIKAKLIVLGSIDDKAYYNELLNAAKELGVDKDIDFVGFVSNPYSYFSKADLFVQTPLVEGFGNVLVEAMACGCPVISTDCPSGPSEILKGGEYGVLISKRDHVKLGVAIKWILLTEDQYQFNSKERANDFNLIKLSDEYLSHLKNTLVKIT